MAGELVGGAFLGAVVQEGAKPITNQIFKGLKFKKTRKNLDSLVERIMPVAKDMKQLNENLDRPKEETGRQLEELEQGKKVVNKHPKVPWWKFCCLPCFQGELQAKEEKIVRTCSVVTPMNTARDVKETLSIVRDLKGRQFNFKRLCDPPVKPDFMGWMCLCIS